jgi:hypothetical protein
MTEPEKWRIEMRGRCHNLQQRCSKFWWWMYFEVRWAGSAGAWYEKGMFGPLDGNSVQLLVGRSDVFETGLLAALQVEGIGTVAD